jgi:dTDP-glucose pyrophosphorylase
MSITNKDYQDKKNQNWHKAKLGILSTIEDAIRSLVSSSLRIVLIVDSSDVFLGTVTDGDIRRGILKGLDLSSPVSEVMNSNAIAVSPEISIDSVLQLMSINKLLQIPVVDSNRNLCGLYTWDEMNSSSAKKNTMIIMAGGKGSRLMPFTENLPKPMVIVNKKPMLQHLIEKASAEGFKNFLLIVCHLKHLIQEHFGDGSKFGIEIKYLEESQPLGTAGGLSLVNKNMNEPFIVTNADVITDVNYSNIIDFHTRNGADATMAVRSFEWQNPYGVVELSGIDILDFIEKPVVKNHINAGIYILAPSVFSELNKNERCDMPDFLMRLKNKNYKVVAYPIHETWMDLGRPKDLNLAINHLNNK